MDQIDGPGDDEDLAATHEQYVDRRRSRRLQVFATKDSSFTLEPRLCSGLELNLHWKVGS